MSPVPLEDLKRALDDYGRERREEGYWSASYAAAWDSGLHQKEADRLEAILSAALSELATLREERERLADVLEETARCLRYAVITVHEYYCGKGSDLQKCILADCCESLAAVRNADAALAPRRNANREDDK